MSKILSQEEIDALLTSAAALEHGGRPETPAAPRSQTVIVYNFRRPDRVSKDQMRSLHFLHDRFARNVSTSLSAYLRVVTEVSILSVEQFTYSEFLMSLPDPTAFYAVSMRPLDGIVALELNPAVAFTMIDRMLGGSGRGVLVNRALTEIEQNVTDAVVKLILENLTETWRGVVDVHFRITGRETRPQMLQVAAPNEVVVLLSFEIRIGETRGVLNLCIPASTIETVSSSFTRSWQKTQREMTPAERQVLTTNLSRLTLSLSAVIDSTLPAGEFMRLKVGDILALDHPITRPVDVRVNGRTKFRGTPLADGPRTAVHIEDMGPVPVAGAA
ncbi:MAG TPA: flagellar motor switch protein FliM [Vicinamibacterales bacterium]